MEGSILVLKGQSRYNVLRLAADEMIDSFTRLGYQVTVFDLFEDDLSKFTNVFLNNKYDLIFSFQALCFEIRLPGSSLSFLNALNTPVFGHIVDHPIYHDGRIAPSQGKNIHLGFIDINHINYIREYYPGIENAHYLPHGGFTGRNNRPYSERSIDIFFPCSYTKPEDVIKSIESLPNVYKNMSYLFIQQMLANPLLTLQDALSLYLQKINFSYSKEEFTQLMTILNHVDSYVRTYSRDQIIRCLLDNNINVTVSGHGWDKFTPNTNHNITILTTEGLDISEILDIMGNSKMVLNHIPTLQNGMHERIYSSMRCGAISMTNDFPCVHEEFTDSKNILLYSENDIMAFANKVKYFLEHADEATVIAESGKKIAEASHTWFHNAKKILQIAGLTQ